MSEHALDDILIVIPARFGSSRLPGKPLVDIAGKPMIVRTAETCLKIAPRDRVVVATDDERIAAVCNAYDIKVEITRSDHLTGTDRVAEVASRIPAGLYVNVQGDEPVFNPRDIELVIQAHQRRPDSTHIGFCPLTEDQWLDSKYIKLTFSLDHRLIYIGRAQVPGSHDGSFKGAYRQVCAYSYTRSALEKFTSVERRTPLEEIEDCEVVRFLELGMPVHVVEMSADSISVDRPEDVARVESRLFQK